MSRQNTKEPQLRSSLTSDLEDPSRARARRMVRAHTRGPAPLPSSSDDEDHEEAISLDSQRTIPDQSVRRRRRQSSASYGSYDSSSDSNDERDRLGQSTGVMSTLLGLYRPKDDARGLDEEERMERNTGRTWKSRFLAHASGRRYSRQRRISSTALFAPSSRRSSRASSFTSHDDDSSTWSASIYNESEGVQSRRRSSTGQSSSSDDGLEESVKRAASIADPERTHRGHSAEPTSSQRLRPEKTEPLPSTHDEKERSSSLPQRSQDVNEPYIPARHFSSPITPALNATLAQKFRAWVVDPINQLWPGVTIDSEGSTPHMFTSDRQHDNYRTMAALVITTSGLAGIANPELARYAPASGPGAETNTGERKISRYEGVNEAEAREEDEAALQMKEEGVQPSQKLTQAEKAMNEGMGRGMGAKVAKAGPLKDDKERKHARHGHHRNRRGKRKQSQIAITKHLSSILQRKRFIEHLAKALLK